jgi:hypothetical protein
LRHVHASVVYAELPHHQHGPCVDVTLRDVLFCFVSKAQCLTTVHLRLQRSKPPPTLQATTTTSSTHTRLTPINTFHTPLHTSPPPTSFVTTLT